VRRLSIQRQRAEDGQGHGRQHRGDADVAGAEDIQIGRDPLPPGWSIHEIGTARMGDDPRTSVTDSSCRLHDVKNVYLADAAPFVCGGTQNTTWSILAMAWRTMDLLQDRMRRGEA
jgi:choline dehydrogenase-like flavoprotein